MQIDAINFIKRLQILQKNLEKNMSTVVEEIAIRMHDDIVDTSAITFSPSWQAAVTIFGRHYFQTPYNSERSDGKTNGLLETIRKETLTLHRENGITKVGLGDIALLDEEAPYWKIFLGYGEFERHIGTRAGGSDLYGFIPYRGANGEIIEDAGFMFPMLNGKNHPGVMPVFMFQDTLHHYKPIIIKSVQQALKKSIPD